MKYLCFGLCLFLIASSAYFVTAGVLAKHIPTTAALMDKVMAEVNGFKGELGSFWAENEIDENHPENIELWNKIALSNPSLIALDKLGKEIEAIIKYHDITGGSEESTENFEKWLKQLHEEWPKVAKELINSYIKIKHGDLNEALKLEQQKT